MIREFTPLARMLMVGAVWLAVCSLWSDCFLVAVVYNVITGAVVQWNFRTTNPSQIPQWAIDLVVFTGGVLVVNGVMMLAVRFVPMCGGEASETYLAIGGLFAMLLGHAAVEELHHHSPQK